MSKTTTEMRLVPLSQLVPYVNNARTHSKAQVTKLRSSLREFGFINPVIIDRDFGIIAGHGRVLAAKEEGIDQVPCVFVDHLTEAQKKAYIIADNRMAMDADWDEDCEINFRKCNWKNVLLGILLFASAVGLNVASELDAELPQYRGNELTVDQFASNFNFYDQLLLNNTAEHMGRDGIIEEPGYTRTIVLPDGGEVEYDPNGQFEFETDGNAIQKITYRHSWYEYDSVFYKYDSSFEGGLDALARWLPGHCRLAMNTAILSQEGEYAKLLSYVEQLKADMKTATGDGQTFTYGNVTISWEIDLEPYRIYEEGSSYPDIYYVALDLTIEYA